VSITGTGPHERSWQSFGWFGGDFGLVDRERPRANNSANNLPEPQMGSGTFFGASEFQHVREGARITEPNCSPWWSMFPGSPQVFKATPGEERI